MAILNVAGGTDPYLLKDLSLTDTPMTDDALLYMAEQIGQNPDLYADALRNADLYGEMLHTSARSAVQPLADAVNGADVYASHGGDPDGGYIGPDRGFLGGRYSFLDGIWDGLTLPFNALGDLLNGSGDHTWARDGTGIASDPAEDWYNIGFWLAAGGGGSSAAGGAASANRRRS